MNQSFHKFYNNVFISKNLTFGGMEMTKKSIFVAFTFSFFVLGLFTFTLHKEQHRV